MNSRLIELVSARLSERGFIKLFRVINEHILRDKGRQLLRQRYNGGGKYSPVINWIYSNQVNCNQIYFTYSTRVDIHRFITNVDFDLP